MHVFVWPSKYPESQGVYTQCILLMEMQYIILLKIGALQWA